VSVTAYSSFGGEVEASTPPMSRLTPSCPTFGHSSNQGPRNVLGGGYDLMLSLAISVGSGGIGRYDVVYGMRQAPKFQ